MSDLASQVVSSSPAASPTGWRQRLLASRFGPLAVLSLVFLGLSLATRLGLLIYSLQQPDASPDLSAVALAKTFAVGFVFDLAATAYAAGPAALIYILLPDRFFRGRVHRALAMGVLFLTLFFLLFATAAEWLFWEDLGVRFNFVAVDYLVYTTEVLGNIWESYPIVWIVAGLAAVTALLHWRVRRWILPALQSPSTLRRRLRQGGWIVLTPLAPLFLLNVDASHVTNFRANNELALNGLYSLVAAFRNNVIPYKDFYVCQGDDEALAHVRPLLAAPGDQYLSDQPADLRRRITARGPQTKCNVVLVVVESLSGEYVGALGDARGLTPNLDKLADQSLFFTNFYATGTRTDRGLEAITLSLPPTPGRSMLKRDGNQNMFSLASVLAANGYESTFVYGGFSAFDNMSGFFTDNGFRTVDQRSFAKEEKTFANAWGLCDEDLFARVLVECDRSYAAGKPFLTLAMTTSNHRPFTFPTGKVDMPQNRPGAVRYTDFAVGKLLAAARDKPWFANTIFVVVADHCANSAGKLDIEVQKYHIPLFIYAPRLIPPRRVEKLAGQMDLAPTLLGLMNVSYTSKFFGRDILADGPGRALLGNYQKIGLLENQAFTVLLLPKKIVSFVVDSAGQRLAKNSAQAVADTISYYQSADYALAHGLQKAD